MDNVDPFGNNVANENPTGQGTFKYGLRFPGQYYDAETGTHYNYYRDYDPSIGRYEQSDPIGLRGGSNTYLYVGANPLRWSDRKGLDVDVPIRPPVAPPTDIGGEGTECRYIYRNDLTNRHSWFFSEYVTAQCFYYCGPKFSCPPNPKDYVRSMIVEDAFNLLRFWPGFNPCPPTWIFYL